MGFPEQFFSKKLPKKGLENARGKKILRAENFSCVFLLNRPLKCEKTAYFTFLTTGK